MRVKGYKLFKSSENERILMIIGNKNAYRVTFGWIISPTSKHDLKLRNVPELIIKTVAFSLAVSRYEGMFYQISFKQ